MRTRVHENINACLYVSMCRKSSMANRSAREIGDRGENYESFIISRSVNCYSLRYLKKKRHNSFSCSICSRFKRILNYFKMKAYFFIASWNWLKKYRKKWTWIVPQWLKGFVQSNIYNVNGNENNYYCCRSRSWRENILIGIIYE